uniref:Calcineurin-like phosphoesterase domain-containing protein n=1 Tax=viral metagenome TaxID=1070528 RepID=A0A6C0C7V6_9ZZZZ
MNVEENFIAFGCWNNGYCGDKVSNGLSMVMDALLNEDKNTNKIIVLGDNYYPGSIELKGKDKSKSKSEKSKVSKSEKGKVGKKDKKSKKGDVKIKKLNRRNLMKGFDCLAQASDSLDAEVYLLTGNHETDKLLDDIDVEYTPENIEQNSYDCLSLELQKEIVVDNAKFNLIGWEPTGFKSDSSEQLSEEGYFDIKHTDSMMYIYLDTNIYEDEANVCGLDQDILRRNVQRKIIIELIKHPGKSVTFFGHVPLFTCRLKKGENIGSLCNNSELIFKDIFNHSKISKLLLNTKYVYYICADTHYYQQSMITLTNGLVLTQYIVGTGGADLDVHSENIGICLPTSIVKKGKRLPIPNTHISESYIIQNEDTFGYLKCEVFDGQLNTMFVNVDYYSRLPKKIKGSKRLKIKKTFKKNKSKKYKKSKNKKINK